MFKAVLVIAVFCFLVVRVVQMLYRTFLAAAFRRELGLGNGPVSEEAVSTIPAERQRSLKTRATITAVAFPLAAGGLIFVLIMSLL